MTTAQVGELDWVFKRYQNRQPTHICCERSSCQKELQAGPSFHEAMRDRKALEQQEAFLRKFHCQEHRPMQISAFLSSRRSGAGRRSPA